MSSIVSPNWILKNDYLRYITKRESYGCIGHIGRIGRI